MNELQPTLGVILAGGRAERIGGDKPFRIIRGRSLLDRVMARIVPQCQETILNADGNPSRFATFGLPVVQDAVGGYQGPLAGLLAALEWCATQRPDIANIVSVAVDCPFLPVDLVSRLQTAQRADNTQIAIAASSGRTHPVIGLWPVELRDELRRALVDRSIRKIGLWAESYRAATVHWDSTPLDPFFNVNNLDDLTEAERLAAIDDARNAGLDRASVLALHQRSGSRMDT